MLQSALHWLGFGLCHQLPERSFFGGSIQVPVCARDTGIYIGFVVSLALISLVHRPDRPKEFPGVAGISAIILMIGAMGIDGVSSYAGWRTTTNDLRLITGLLCGFAMAAIVVPMLNDELWIRASRSRVLSPAWRLGVWLAGVPVVYALVRYAAPLLGAVYPVLVAVAILTTLTAVNLVIVGLFPVFERRAERLSDAWLAILVAFVLSLAEIIASAAFRVAVETLAGKVG
jgi:uncharacterized membrane protein